MPIVIHNREYITVAERVKAIHEAEKIFSISTELLNNTPVVVKATVTTPKGTFTGISYANFDKAIEKQSPYEVAETSAVGRALGFAGYGLVDDIASADEMVKAGVKPTFNQLKKEAKEDIDDLVIDFEDSPKILRDTKGHTTCVTCGKVVSPKVEQFSISKYGKVLCMDHQKQDDDSDGLPERRFR